MEFTGRYAIRAEPETVWRALHDPAMLKDCIPGCEAVERTGAEDFSATVTLKIGPIKARFQGKVSLSEEHAPVRCRLAGEGEGGPAGFARGEALVELAPTESGTELSYRAEAQVGGKLAQIGQRLIDGAARQIADQFFAALSERLGPQESATTAVAMAEEAPAISGTTIWTIGLVAVALILILMFTVVM
jgi:carbon monoxide dehydrogenase subunit G